ncbi:hypothetical protein G3N57_34050, partial [Paraburkholderia sp. Se-20369]|nr:hypothetical protein [Paraburkholderia sp. Se-20369]
MAAAHAARGFKSDSSKRARELNLRCVDSPGAMQPAAIAEQLRKHEEMGTPTPRPTRVAFVVSPNEARPKVLKINEA